MKSLSTILAGESLESLRALAEWWGADRPEYDDSETRQRLERAMRDTIAARFVWERLGEAERRLLFAIVGPSARNWWLVEGLAERAHLSPEECGHALAQLTQHRVAFLEDAKVQGGELVGQRATFYGYTMPRNAQAPIEEKSIAYVPTELATALYTAGRELFIPIADRTSKTLDELLAPYRQGDLDQIGRRFGLTLQAYYSRAEVRAAMAQNLAQAEAVRYALARVEPRLRRVYEWLRERGGTGPVAEIRSRFDVDGSALSALLHGLEDYALAFDAFHDGERVLFIPHETLANLKKAEGRAHVSVGLAERDMPGAIQPFDTTFLWDLAVIVAAAYHQDIELTRSGALPKRAAQRLVPMLVGERARTRDDDAVAYVELLKQEAAELGLVLAPASSSKARGRLAPGPKLESWARHDQVMQARRLFRRWPTDRWWIDLPGANYQEWMTFYLELPIARELVQRLLKDCKPGVWYSLSSFLATVQGDNPYVLRPSQRNAGESGFKLADDLRAQWERTDGEIITGIFRSTLYELGLVTLGYDGDRVPSLADGHNPVSFMLTDLGYEALHSDLSASQQPLSRSLVVQPNFQVLLMEPYMPALYWLVRFASLEQVGRVSRFTFTREALERGLAGGATIDDVVAFLEHHCQKALPQNVIFTLRDWARQAREAARTQPGPRLFQVSSEKVAGEMVASPKLKSFRLRLAGPRAIQVPPEASIGDLLRALERLGYAKFLGGIEEFVATATGSMPSRRRGRTQAPAVLPATSAIGKGA